MAGDLAELGGAGLDFVREMKHRRSLKSDHLLGAIAEQAFGAGIEQADDALRVGGDDRHPGCRVQHRLQIGACRAHGALLLLAFQNGADPAGEQTEEVAVGVIEWLPASLGVGEGQGAEWLAAHAHDGADIAFQGELAITGVVPVRRVGHMGDGQRIVVLQGQAAVGVAQFEQLAVAEGVVGRYLYQHLVLLALDTADDAQRHAEMLRAQAQRLAQLLGAAQAGQRSDLIERAQRRLLALHQALRAAPGAA